MPLCILILLYVCAFSVFIVVQAGIRYSRLYKFVSFQVVSYISLLVIRYNLLLFYLEMFRGCLFCHEIICDFLVHLTYLSGTENLMVVGTSYSLFVMKQ